MLSLSHTTGHKDSPIQEYRDKEMKYKFSLYCLSSLPENLLGYAIKIRIKIFFYNFFLSFPKSVILLVFKTYTPGQKGREDGFRQFLNYSIWTVSIHTNQPPQRKAASRYRAAKQ